MEGLGVLTVLAIYLQLTWGYTTPAGDLLCGRDYCVEQDGVYCDAKSKTCKCPPDMIGNGRVQCVDPKKTCLCTIHGDPHIINFGYDSFTFPLPCHHVLADFVTPPSRRTPGGCKVVISGRATYPDNGKNTIYSFERQVEIVVTTTANVFAAILNEKGFAWKKLRRVGPRRRRSRIGRLVVQTGHDFSDFFYLHVMPCDITVKFRDYDGFFAVSKPIGSVGMSGVCGSCNSAITPSDKANKLPDKTVMERYLKSLSNVSPIDGSPANQYPSCTDLTDLQKSCPADKKAGAVELCSMLLQDLKTNECLVKVAGTKGVEDRFVACFKSVCGGAAPCGLIAQAFQGCADTPVVKAYQAKCK
ncbi:uncharacterized protein LOC124143951 [Haliotis rufescens]|uniref:uncharacterized protein LOC124143951 n=1 Tax=Haliotis rufescens TaxID=6454 RepID=UPI00201F167F|nr:uncharacterized protein LOC124143951 [Haliotis rufescens]